MRCLIPIAALIICAGCATSSAPAGAEHWALNFPQTGAQLSDDEQLISDRWHRLVENSGSTRRKGQVVLAFNHEADGRITDMRVLKSNVSETQSLLCQKAVLDPAPFGGGRECEVVATFTYR